MADSDAPTRGRTATRTPVLPDTTTTATTDAPAASDAVSRSRSPLALRPLARLVARVIHTVLPTALEAPLIKLRDDIAATSTALTAAYARGDLLGAHSAKLLAMKEEEEERLEVMLRDRESALDVTRRELEDMRDVLMAEISKSEALAELYNSSHERRRRVIEELALVKVTLERVVDEKERLLAFVAAKADANAPPVPRVPADLAAAAINTTMTTYPPRSPSAKSVRFSDAVDVSVIPDAAESDDEGESSSADTELEVGAAAAVAPAPSA
ncbi:hypothetical protein BC828DRAFT_376965 [Blastocladiella britannica]|nr:hypothetical protein BC828DRAFT_376965 [Blastocladiella britannica]